MMRETATNKTRHRFRRTRTEGIKSYFANTAQQVTGQDVAGYRNVNNPLLIRTCLARTMKTMLHSAARILLQKCSVTSVRMQPTECKIKTCRPFSNFTNIGSGKRVHQVFTTCAVLFKYVVTCCVESLSFTLRPDEWFRSLFVF